MKRSTPRLLVLGFAALLAASTPVPGTGNQAEAAKCSSKMKYVKGWGCIPKSVYRQAKKNCAQYNAPASGCLCDDGGKIGACGN
jgi:hypothetical protein